MSIAVERFWNEHFLIPYMFSCVEVNILVPNSMWYNFQGWSKMSTLQMKFLQFKTTPILLPTRHILPFMRPFKWGTARSFISRGIRSTNSQTFCYPSLLNKVGLFSNFWLWHVVTLMPLEIKLHAVPHLKVLNNG